LITGWYAFSTKSMLNIMKEDFDISNRPYLSVAIMDKRTDGSNLVYSISLTNSGKIPAIITDTVIKAISVESKDEKLLTHNINSPTILNPGESTILNPGEFIKQDLVRITKEGINQQYKIKLTINYKSPSKSNAKYTTTYLYRYQGNPDLQMTIISSDMK